MKSLLYTKSSPGYGEENDIFDYGIKLKIKKNDHSFYRLKVQKTVLYCPPLSFIVTACC